MVWLGSRDSYTPKRGAGRAVILHLMQNPSDKLKNVLPIGVYDGHVFLIMDTGRLVRRYACAHCRARFTEAELLQRHANRHAQGKTVIDCPTELVIKALQIAYEKMFKTENKASPAALIIVLYSNCRLTLYNDFKNMSRIKK